MSTSSTLDPAPGSTAPQVERLKAGSVGLTSVMFMALARVCGCANGTMPSML